MVDAGKEGDKFNQQSHLKGQDEIKMDRTEEENEDQDDKTTLVSQRLFITDTSSRVVPVFFHLSATTILKTSRAQRVNKSQRRQP